MQQSDKCEQLHWQLHSISCDICCAGLQFQHVQGQLVNLLRVAVEDSMDLGLRQIAAITFKNLVRKDWDPSGAARNPRSRLPGAAAQPALHVAWDWHACPPYHRQQWQS